MLNPLIQFDSPRAFENADGSIVRSSPTAKLSEDLLATREPANPAPGEVSYLVIGLNPAGSIGSALLGLTATPPIAVTAGQNPVVSINAATTELSGSMSALDKAKLDGIASGAAVAGVNVTAPIVKTGSTTTPTIGISAASGAAAGSMSSTHYTLVNNILSSSAVTVGAGDAFAITGTGDMVSAPGGVPTFGNDTNISTNYRVTGSAAHRFLSDNTLDALIDEDGIDLTTGRRLRINGADVVSAPADVPTLGSDAAASGVDIRTGAGPINLSVGAVPQLSVEDSIVTAPARVKCANSSTAPAPRETGAFTFDPLLHTTVKADTGGGSFAATLPPVASCLGCRFTLVKIDAANTVTLTPDGSETISGAADYPLTANWSFVTVEASQFQHWLVVAKG